MGNVELQICLIGIKGEALDHSPPYVYGLTKVNMFWPDASKGEVPHKNKENDNTAYYFCSSAFLLENSIKSTLCAIRSTCPLPPAQIKYQSYQKYTTTHEQRFPNTHNFRITSHSDYHSHSKQPIQSEVSKAQSKERPWFFDVDSVTQLLLDSLHNVSKHVLHVRLWPSYRTRCRPSLRQMCHIWFRLLVSRDL